MPIRRLIALALTALLAGCATLPGERPAACMSPGPSVDPGALPDLSGRYRLVMTGTQGRAPRRTAAGTLALTRRTAPQLVTVIRTIDLAEVQPYHGTAEIDLQHVGAMTEGTLSSTDSLAPGAAITLANDEGGRTVARLGLGSTNNDPRVAILDGAITTMRIERAGPRGFSGRWSASFSYTSYRAGGTFCATRTP